MSGKEEGTEGNCEYESFITGSLASVVSITFRPPQLKQGCAKRGRPDSPVLQHQSWRYQFCSSLEQLTQRPVSEGECEEP